VVGIGHLPPVSGPARGDVHLVDFAEAGGHVIRGPHPAVVVQSDRMRRSSTTLVVPMSSAPRSAASHPPYLVSVSARQSGLPRDGFAKCDQVTTIPAVRLGPRLGRLNRETLDQVDNALRFVLAI
jgi:mRNA-degrading endonuclease toxin of MazEF toxin-antitoxin module